MIRRTEPGTKLGAIKTEIVEENTAADLNTSLLAYFAAAGANQRFIDIRYVISSSKYSALIVWTE